MAHILNLSHRHTHGLISLYFVDGAGYLWEVISSHHDAVRGPLQDLPHAVIEAQRGSVQTAVDLPPF